jgi:hypothetical protein
LAKSRQGRSTIRDAFTALAAYPLAKSQIDHWLTIALAARIATSEPIAAGRLRRMNDSYRRNLPLGVTGDVRPQHWWIHPVIRRPASVALPAFTRVTGQRQLSPGANGEGESPHHPSASVAPGFGASCSRALSVQGVIDLLNFPSGTANQEQA